MPNTSNPYRLDRSVVPSAYRIYLTPDLDDATFAGRVEIDVRVDESSDRVTLNAAELTLGAATLTTGSTCLRSGDPELDSTYDTATFVFDAPLPLGPATLEIAFTGILNDRLVGFYRSTFTDSAGVVHAIATTQLQECHARQVFPCFDEPSFKATFQSTLTVPRDLAAYSNSPVASDTDLGNGQRMVSFAPTMVMSTYLNAFIVGPFEETAAVEALGTPVRVVYPRGQGHLASFALETSRFALEYFSEYFNIPYPGDKIDHVAIPDFAFGAMENLGCVTYREADLLLDTETASLAEKQRVVKVIAHETAHMWFGDLVTMDWWEGIWLNEAFATFMEVLCTDAMHPDWNTWTKFSGERDLAYAIDGLNSTRPIEFSIVAPQESLAMVDALTYEKGAAVIRMIEQYLGADVFRDAIRGYLLEHSYANTVTTDLWDALEETSGHPVRDVMGTWIYQGGHPVVSLTDGVLRQEPFAYGSRDPEGAIGESWRVPLLVRSLSDGSIDRHLLGDEPERVDVAAPVLVNAGGSGYYRSRYDSTAIADLAERLDELTSLERATFASDAWAMLFSGRSPWTDFATVAASLADFDEPVAWTNVAHAVGMVDRALRDDQRDQLADVVRRVFGPPWQRLGWDARPGDSELTMQLRASVLSVLGTIGRDESIQKEAHRRFDADEVEGNLASAIVHVVAHDRDPRDYEVVLERYRRGRTPQDEQRYLRGLAGFDTPELARATAEMCYSEVRSQDAPNTLAYASALRVNGPSVWRYSTSRWDESVERFPAYLMPRLAFGVSTYITDGALADEVEDFHRSHDLGGLKQKPVDQQIELMRVGLAFTAAIRPQF
ncbi:MAG: M1 family metallopeptidase [Acidimicrobiales bacterium]